MRQSWFARNKEKDFSNVTFERKPMFLGVNYILSDLRKLKKWEIAWISVFAVFLTIISLCQFDASFKFESWIWDVSYYSSFQKAMGALSGMVAFMGVMYTYLGTKRFFSAYSWGIIAVVLYGIYCFSVAWTGQMMVSLIFDVPLILIGSVLWRKKLDKNNIAIIKKITWNDIILTIFLLGAVWVSMWYGALELDTTIRRDWLNQSETNYDGTTNTYWLIHREQWKRAIEATADSLSIVATTMYIRRLREEWIFWISLNFVKLPLHAGLSGQVNVPIIIMICFYTINAFIGLYKWWIHPELQKRKELRIQLPNQN